MADKSFRILLKPIQNDAWCTGYETIKELYISNHTNIRDNLLAKILEAYKLFQDYPKLFYPMTYLRNGFSVFDEVKIEVCNSLVEKVTVPEDNYLLPRNHATVCNVSQSTCSTYFYPFNAGSYHIL